MAVGLVASLALLHLRASGQEVAPQPSAVQRLEQDVRAATESPGVQRATWGISVRSLDGRGSLLSHNARALLVPGSISKLVAVAVGLDVLGPDFRFETTVRATGPVVDGVLLGDLVVSGSGDPSIGGRGGADLSTWIAALRQAGVVRIDGRVIGDDDALEDPRPGAMWSWDDLGYTSGALFGALNYAENRMLVTLTPGDLPGVPASLSVEATAVDRSLTNATVTSDRNTPAFVWPEQRPGEEALTLAGTLPAGGRQVRLFVSAGNPTRWFAQVLRRELMRNGIDVRGEAVDVDEAMPKPDMSAARTLFVHRSPPLSELVRPLLKDSINLYGEAVLRATTAISGGRTNDEALMVLRERLEGWGIASDSLQLVDGSGLSRRDTLAADTMVEVLARLWDPSFQSPWMTGLPVAGRDGTLAARLRGTRAESNLRGKTGTLSNIRSLAGYVYTRDGEPLAFAVIVNNFEGTGAQAQRAIDQIASALADFTRQLP